ncbi:MAG: heterodisulfide reductase-related iron-sulfur binding cluster [Actinomycetota bacterium]|nr:heterodisulfide reductase-related iron-sulfur binding cluster [Actinomycetota bacterium]
MALDLTAWDAHKPPEPELIDDCVHCGFCLPTCPTYALWREEMDSPRGRIQLMALGHEQPLSDEIVLHLDNCLGCMACVTACPSGVQYHKLIEDARHQIERNLDRPLVERLERTAIFRLFPHPGRLRAAAPLLTLQRRLGLTALLRRIPRLRPLLDLAPEVPLRTAFRALPAVTPARGTSRGRVGFLQGCVQRVFFSAVNEATVGVLAAEGFEVHAPRLPRCCGALQLHAGDEGAAVAQARRTIEAFEGFDVVVANAAGCGSAMKDYPHALRDDPVWRERAEAFSAKVRDVSELLAEHEPVAPRRPVPLRVAYHDPCHLAHAQGVRAQPRALLRSIPGLELLEPAEWELCCGSAGVYNLVKPTPARQLGERKVANLRATGAQAVAAANPGCALQIQAVSAAEGTPLPVFHPMEILHAALTDGRLRQPLPRSAR